MMNANDLFKNLGFVKVKDKDYIIVYKYDGDKEKYWGFELIFWKSTKEFRFASQEGYTEYIGLDILKAIQQQIAELPSL